MQDEKETNRNESRPRLARRIVRATCWAVAGLAALTLIARAFSGMAWRIDMVANFAAQEAVACVALGLVAILLRARWAGAALLLIGVIHGVWLADGRAPRARAGVDESRVVRVMTFNYLVTNVRSEPLIDYLIDSDVDVVVILEAQRRLMNAVEASEALRERFPYQSLHRRMRQWNGIKLSRWPLEEANLDGSASAGEKLDFVGGRSEIVRRPGGSFVLTASRSMSPRSAADWSEGNRVLRRSGAILREQLISKGYPVIVCMDANATPSGYRTRLLHRVAGLERAKPLWVLRGTWPSWMPPALRLAIDDVLVSEGVRVRSWKTVEGDFGSDHVPVEVELVLPEGPGRSDEP